MDELDHALLLRLTKDARASVTDLSQALNVSRGTVQNRIEKLCQRDVIRRFTVELGQAEVDHQISAFALLRLKTDGDRAVRDALHAMAEVSDVHSLSGQFDLVVELRVSSLKHLDRALDHIRAVPAVAETQSHIRLASVRG